MSDENTKNSENENKEVTPQEVDFNTLPDKTDDELKALARRLKVPSAHLFGRDRLIDKIQIAYLTKSKNVSGLQIEVLDTETNKKEVVKVIPDRSNSGEPIAELVPLTPDEYAEWLVASKLALKRVSIICHDKNRQDIDGEVYSITSGGIGTISKWIPYDVEFYTNGYYVEQGILDTLAEKVYQDTRVVAKRIEGLKNLLPTFTNKPMFTIEYLPINTKEELKELALRQEAANRANTED